MQSLIVYVSIKSNILFYPEIFEKIEKKFLGALVGQGTCRCCSGGTNNYYLRNRKMFSTQYTSEVLTGEFSYTQKSFGDISWRLYPLPSKAVPAHTIF